MPKSNPLSRLVAAAAAVDEELHLYDEIARQAKRIELDGEKALSRAARLLEQSTASQPRIQQKLQALVTEIEGARVRQQDSLASLVEVAGALEARASQFDALMKRFAALGHSAQRVNEGAGELAPSSDGGAETQLLNGLRALEEQMNGVVAEARDLARDAEGGGWSEIGRQAKAVSEQVNAAKNKLALAHRAVAGRAPS